MWELFHINIMTKGSLFSAKKIALIGVLTATCEGAKLALSGLPNIEVVTLLCALYGFVFGIYGVVATFFFVITEVLIWGIGTWFFSYIIHWNAVCFIYMLLGRKQVRNRFLLTSVAVLLTIWFGVLTSLVDIGLFSGSYDDFGYRFALYYIRGVVFYIVQIVCNVILFSIAFLPMEKLLGKLRDRFL